ncbi:MAG TPA: glycerol kinase [Treponema sp.]|nr:glycerol kinase [Treponema sp.]
MPYIISIDQSTSCTKALLFDSSGNLAGRTDLPHRQLVDGRGWVEHDLEEIYGNLIKSVRMLLEKTGVSDREIAGAALSNQRETSVAWHRGTGKPVYNAIVWQCGRGAAICSRIKQSNPENAELIKSRTGLNLSPYFSAAKLAWILENVPEAKRLALQGNLVCSTMDSWLVYRLTKEHAVKTDYSNASRTQLFNIYALKWDSDICGMFGIPPAALPEVCPSDSLFGSTDFDGVLDNPVPLHGVLGDSQGALFAQGCLTGGMVKATYGTGSSVMMNTGDNPVACKGLVTSLAWGMGKDISYVLEGNINYTGATIEWLKNDLQLIGSAAETEPISQRAAAVPGLYLVPAFSGLGAPYWNENARTVICGIDRTTGKAEIVRAAEESIAYQIADIVLLMKEQTGFSLSTLRVDGGPTRDAFLMQFQADIVRAGVRVAAVEELSGMGPAVAAGSALGVYDTDSILNKPPKKEFAPKMTEQQRIKLYAGWKRAVNFALTY